MSEKQKIIKVDKIDKEFLDRIIRVVDNLTKRVDEHERLITELRLSSIHKDKKIFGKEKDEQ